MPKTIVNSTPRILLKASIISTGTLGLLMRAKDRGFVPEVRPLVDELRANGFRINDEVVAAVLEILNEL